MKHTEKRGFAGEGEPSQKTTVFYPVRQEEMEETKVFSSLEQKKIPTKKKKHSGKHRKIFAVVFAAVALTAFIVAFLFLFPSHTAEPVQSVFYLENDHLFVFSSQYGTNDLGEYNVPQIEDLEQNAMGAFAADKSGRYIVYPEVGYFSQDGKQTGSICTVDLSDGSQKIIVENCLLGENGYDLTQDGQMVFYLTNDGETHTLYRWDRVSDQIQIVAEDVQSFELLNGTNGTFVLWKDSAGNGYETNVKLEGTAISLGQNITIEDISLIKSYEEENAKQVYFYQTSEGLFSKAPGESAVLIAQGTCELLQAYGDGSCFFKKLENRSVPVTDLIVNDFETNQELAHPVIDDFVLEQEDELGYQYFQDVSAWYYESKWYQIFSEDFVWFLIDGEPGSSGQGLDAATIRKTDWNAYRDALEKYYQNKEMYSSQANQGAQELWKQLQGIFVEVPEYTVCYFDGKESVVVKENFVDVWGADEQTAYMAGLFLEETAEIPLSQIYGGETEGSTEEVANKALEFYLAQQTEKAALYLCQPNESQKIRGAAQVGKIKFSQSSAIYYEVYESTSDETFSLNRVTIENGMVASDVAVVPECGKWWLLRDGTVLYQGKGSEASGDLYGSEGLIAANVLSESVKVAPGGNRTVFLTQYSDAKKAGTLAEYSGGEVTTLRRGVESFVIGSDGSIVCSVPSDGHDGGDLLLLYKNEIETEISKSAKLLAYIV